MAEDVVSVTAAGEETGRIGPNAILQVAAALRTLTDEQTTQQIFTEAGLDRWLDEPPEAMVPENTVAALHQTVRAQLKEPLARRVLVDAGDRTADYVLHNRIPGPVRVLLRILPPALSGPMLLRAIQRNAWTFVGSGDFHVDPGRPTILRVEHNPVINGESASAPVCHWHATVFEKLFQRLVWRDASVREVSCMAAGDQFCSFEVYYRAR